MARKPNKQYLDYRHYVGREAWIIPGTEFSDQIRSTGYEPGVVIDAEPGHSSGSGGHAVWMVVRWPNGYQNSYPFPHLRFPEIKQVNDSYRHLLKSNMEEVQPF